MAIKVWLRVTGKTFCNFALDIESVLKDQQYYYLDGYSEIQANL